MKAFEFVTNNSWQFQTFEETTFPLQPYTLMVYSLDEWPSEWSQMNAHEEEIVSNKNTGEDISICKRQVYHNGSLTSIEIKRGANKTMTKKKCSGFGCWGCTVHFK